MMRQNTPATAPHNTPQAGQAMSEFTTVARVDEIPEGEARSFQVEGRIIGIFHEAGKFHAMDDICPHMGASLASGYMEDGIVTCPWHAWRFCYHDGNWCDNPTISIDTFELRIEGDEIQVHVPPRD